MDAASGEVQEENSMASEVSLVRTHVRSCSCVPLCVPLCVSTSGVHLCVSMCENNRTSL